MSPVVVDRGRADSVAVETILRLRGRKQRQSNQATIDPADITGWCRQTFGLVPWGEDAPENTPRIYAKQSVIFEAVRDAERVAVVGCNSCVAPETRILNPLTGEQVPIAEVRAGMPVLGLDHGRVVVAAADRPFIKGMRDLYQVRLDNGSTFEATLGHRVLTPQGWRPLGELHVGALIAASSLSSLEYASVPARLFDGCARHCSIGAPDYRQYYSLDYRHGGELPLLVVGNDRCAFQPQDDALARNLCCWHKDDLVDRSKHSRSCPQCGLPSKSALDRVQVPFWNAMGCSAVSLPFGSLVDGCQGALRASRCHDGHCYATMTPATGYTVPGEYDGHKVQSTYAALPLQSLQSYYNPTWQPLASITFSRTAQFYDVHVPHVNNYYAEGVFHHNSGKDWTAARIALWWVAYWRHQGEPAKVIITGPTFRQVHQVVWQELRAAYLGARMPFGGALREQPLLRWDEQTFIFGFATDKPYQLQGFHSPHLLIIVTEAHGVAQGHFSALWRLNPNCMLLTGNPISEGGEFHDSHHNKTHLWRGITITAWDTPNVIEGREVIPGLVTKDDIRRGAENWGEDSPLYRITFKAEWVEGMGQQVVVPLSLAKAAEANWDAGAYPLEGVEVVACDVARFGKNKTVVYSRRGRVACVLWRVQGAPTTEITRWLVDYHSKHPRCQLVVDGVGVGGGVIDQLREQGIGVIEFQAGGGADDSRHFADRSAEVWWRMREGYEAGLAVYPDQETRTQVSSRCYTVERDRRIRLEHKDLMMVAGRQSPDEADALAMTFALHWSLGPRLQAGSDADGRADPRGLAPGEHGGVTVEAQQTIRTVRGRQANRWSKLKQGHRRA